MPLTTQRFSAHRFDATGVRSVTDTLAVEAVLQIRVNGIAYTTTVRTPGADEALARGLLFTESVVRHPDAVLTFTTIADPETGITGCLDVTVPARFVEKELADRRSAMASSSCGMCGLREPEEIALRGEVIRVAAARRIDPARLAEMFASMRARQEVFGASGGCHAAAAFPVDGTLLQCFEDIGRHNAVDKVIGALIRDGALATADVLLVSGRLSYEIVFKAYQAGIPHLFAVSAPSSLAVEMGERFGMTIGGFCREGRVTVYASPRNLTDNLA